MSSEITDRDRIRVMSEVFTYVRSVSGANLGLAVGATTGVLALLLLKSDPDGRDDLVEIAIAKLHELVPPSRGATHGPPVRCVELRCNATIDMAVMGKKSKWFHGAIGWLCPSHAP